MLEFLKEKKDTESGDPIALSEKEIKNLIKFVNASKKDVFYDLGSGFGEIVIQFVKQTKIRKACGIEEDIKRFLHSIEFTRDELTKKQLKRIDFWRSDYCKFDFSDATVVYNGLDAAGGYKRRDYEEIKLYNKLFAKKEVKIIKRDFPLIGYKPVRAFRSKTSSWFFMMKTPLEKHRLRDYNEWLYYVFRKKGKNTTDIISHYKRSYKNREIDLTQKDVQDFKKGFLRMAKKNNF